MAINTNHTNTTRVEIIYYSNGSSVNGLHETMIGNINDIQEHVREILIKHNFVGADVWCGTETGEALVIVERT